MVDRRLILSREGLPVCWALMAGEVRRRILLCRDEDVELLQVFSVPSSSVLSTGEDITSRFALEWSKEFPFGDGIEPADYLARFPAFVREHAGTELITRWAASIAQRDESFIPDPLRRTA